MKETGKYERKEGTKLERTELSQCLDRLMPMGTGKPKSSKLCQNCNSFHHCSGDSIQQSSRNLEQNSAHGFIVERT